MTNIKTSQIVRPLHTIELGTYIPILELILTAPYNTIQYSCISIV